MYTAFTLVPLLAAVSVLLFVSFCAAAFIRSAGWKLLKSETGIAVSVCVFCLCCGVCYGLFGGYVCEQWQKNHHDRERLALKNLRKNWWNFGLFAETYGTR